MISHGWNDPRTDRPRFHLLFDYMGADDPSPHLAVPAAIDFLNALYPNGLAGTMEHNRSLALAARDMLCEFLAVDHPAPDSMIGSSGSGTVARQHGRDDEPIRSTRPPVVRQIPDPGSGVPLASVAATLPEDLGGAI